MDRVPAAEFTSWVAEHRQTIDGTLALMKKGFASASDLAWALDDSRWNSNGRPQACYAEWILDWNQAVSDLEVAAVARLKPADPQPPAVGGALRSFASATTEYKLARDEGLSGTCDDATPTGPVALSHPAPPPAYRPYKFSTGGAGSFSTGSFSNPGGHHPDWFLAVYAEYLRDRTPLQAAVDSAHAANDAGAFKRALLQLAKWDRAFYWYVEWEIVPEACYGEAAAAAKNAAGQYDYWLEDYEAAIERGDEASAKRIGKFIGSTESMSPASRQATAARLVAQIPSSCGLDVEP